MLIKYTVITTKSLVLVEPTITKYFNMEDVIEVLCGESFSSVKSVNLICLEEINIDELKEKGKTIHIKIITK